MKRLNLFLVISAVLVALSSVCIAAPETINLNFNSSKYLRLPQTITRIYISNGNIVKVKQPTTSMNEVLITALEKAGSTNVFIWTADGARYEYEVTVFDKKMSEAQLIEQEINLPNVRVKKFGDNFLLQGTVENETEHAHVLRIVSLFTKEARTIRDSNLNETGEYQAETKEEKGSKIVDEIEILNPRIRKPDIELPVEMRIEDNLELPNVHVKKIGDSIFFEGTVADEKEHEYALQVAKAFGFKDDAVIDRIEVLNPQSIIELQIEQAIGLPDVHVKMVDKRILLTGTVQNQYERNYAVQIARLYVGSGSDSSLSFGSNVSPSLHTQGAKSSSSSTTLSNDNKVEDSGSVIDLLQMLNPTQIRLEAQIISINPEDAKNIGILYGASAYSNDTRTPANPGIFYLGEANYRGSGNSFRNNPWSWLMERHADINLSINALITKTKAKILSRPSVMTMSGEQATIQIGGEIPYSVSNSNGTTVNFRNYGIILQFKPIVDAQNRIVSTISTEVSNLSGQSVDGQPIIATRRADSVVTMDSGSTIIIGGLMDSSERKVVTKIPLLGDIPILGEFFKYTSKTKDRQELIILVTPYIVSGYESSRAGMSDEMRDYYHKGQREKNHLRDVDLNEPPPVIPSKKKNETAKTKANSEKVMNPEKNDDNNGTKKTGGWSVGIGIFGDAF